MDENILPLDCEDVVSKVSDLGQPQFEYAYLFGSVFPARGIGEAMLVPWVNKEIMIEHLK